MTPDRWELIRKRASLALPLVQALIVYYGVTSDHAAALWISLVSVLITGVALGADPRTNSVNVSRETFTIFPEPFVSRETSSESVACQDLHGSAEPHVLGCEGWSKSSE
jgi:hypothetical protein